MQIRLHGMACVIAGVWLGSSPKEPVVVHHASGTFGVKLAPQPAAGGPEGAAMDRLLIDGTSKGEMLTPQLTITVVPDSAAAA